MTRYSPAVAAAQWNGAERRVPPAGRRRPGHAAAVRGLRGRAGGGHAPDRGIRRACRAGAATRSSAPGTWAELEPGHSVVGQPDAVRHREDPDPAGTSGGGRACRRAQRREVTALTFPLLAGVRVPGSRGRDRVAVGGRGDPDARPAGAAAGRAGRGRWPRTTRAGCGSWWSTTGPSPTSSRPTAAVTVLVNDADTRAGRGPQHRDPARWRPTWSRSATTTTCGGRASCAPRSRRCGPAGRGVRQLRDRGGVRRHRCIRGWRGGPRSRHADLLRSRMVDGALLHLPGPAGRADRTASAWSTRPSRAARTRTGTWPCGPRGGTRSCTWTSRWSGEVERVLALRPAVAGQGRLAALDAGAPPGHSQGPPGRGAGVRPAVVRPRVPAASAVRRAGGRGGRCAAAPASRGCRSRWRSRPGWCGAIRCCGTSTRAGTASDEPASSRAGGRAGWPAGGGRGDGVQLAHPPVRPAPQVTTSVNPALAPVPPASGA